eukprot:TRINITY_DN80446_c0_g1_i1.p1 TRINITY_DN80446_c0_g1~~TRINITY_DN80446_c0_g1_i1.p1  ORF type:complete len:980 (-),score=178.09 TRINITY_DN80446_c0_g1_i1:169-3108(-)
MFRRKQRKSSSSSEGHQIADEQESVTVQLRHVCLQYPYRQIEAATNGFDKANQLGEGSAGTVFRAELPDGSYAAVKVIDLSALGDNAAVAGFEDEILILSKFRHPNLVVLMGWAREGARRFLIYEWLPGGDVAARLAKAKEGRAPLRWVERLNICRDSATGLAHLHNATPRAFHRDIKSANILLGHSAAKMADFGLSCVAKTQTGSAVDCEFPSGTPGYTCPHYINSGKVTEGSEVYSFGMVMLELLLNMVPAGMRGPGQPIVFQIDDCVRPGTPGALERAVANADPLAAWPQPLAAEVAALALRCVDRDEAQRPQFNDVCRALRSLQERFPASTPSHAVPPPMSMPPPGVQGLPPPGVQGPPPVGVPGLLMFGPPGPHGPPHMVAQGPGAPHPHFAHGQPGMVPGVPQPGLWPGHPGHPGHPGQFPQGVPPGMMHPQLGVPHGALPPHMLGAAPGNGSVMLPPGGFGPPGPGPYFGPGPGFAGTAPGMAPMQVAPPMGVAPPVQVLPAPNYAEVSLEIRHVHLAPLGSLRPEYRVLPLLAHIDSEGRRIGRIGRQHQPAWFEAVLVDAADLSRISREAVQFTWGGPDPATAALSLQVLGSGTVVVDDSVIHQGEAVLLKQGALVSFAFQTQIIMSLIVRCTPSVPLAGPPPEAASEQQPAAAQSAPEEPLVEMPTMPFPHQMLDDDALWHMECIFAAGYSPEEFLAMPQSQRKCSFALPAPDGQMAIQVGRQHQPHFFESLLARDTSALMHISRSHFRLELKGPAPNVDEAGAASQYEPTTLRVTNLSQNLALVAQQLVREGEAAEIRDGDTFSFVHQHKAPASDAPKADADDAVGATTLPGHDRIDDQAEITPFLTLRLTAPLPPRQEVQTVYPQPVGAEETMVAKAALPTGVLAADYQGGIFASSPDRRERRSLTPFNDRPRGGSLAAEAALIVSSEAIPEMPQTTSMPMAKARLLPTAKLPAVAKVVKPEACVLM